MKKLLAGLIALSCMSSLMLAFPVSAESVEADISSTDGLVYMGTFYLAQRGKTQYSVGEELDLTGLSVELYAHGAEDVFLGEFLLEDYSEYAEVDISDFDSSVAGEYDIYIYPLHDTIRTFVVDGKEYDVYLEAYPQCYGVTVGDEQSESTTEPLLETTTMETTVALDTTTIQSTASTIETTTTALNFETDENGSTIWTKTTAESTGEEQTTSNSETIEGSSAILTQSTIESTTSIEQTTTVSDKGNSETLHFFQSSMKCEIGVVNVLFLDRIGDSEVVSYSIEDDSVLKMHNVYPYAGGYYFELLGLSEGETTVTVYNSDGESASCYITVIPRGSEETTEPEVVCTTSPSENTSNTDAEGSTGESTASTSTTTTTKPATEANQTGDVNGDGSVNILDVISINKAVLGKDLLTDVQNKAADVNKDNKVDATDSLNVLKYIVGLIKTFDDIQ